MSECMKVAVVYPLPVPYHHPLFEKIAALDGIDLKVLFCRKQQLGRDWAVPELSYPHIYLRNRGVTFQGNDLRSIHFNPSVVKELHLGRYDAIVVSGLVQPTTQLAIAYARLTRTPYLIWSESHSVLSRRRPLHIRSLKRLIYPRLVRRAAGFLVTGEYAKQYLKEFGGRVDRVFVVSNTIDTPVHAKGVREAKTEASRLKSKWGIADCHVILFVGRFVAAKGLDVLVKAFGSVARREPRAALILVGDGPLREELEHLVQTRGIPRVFFPGFVQPSDLFPFWAMADIFVLPSIRETWGTVINEAMASRLPIIASRVVGAAGDLVREGANGFVVLEGDSGELADALVDVLSDDTRRLKMGEASWEIIQSWGVTSSVKEFAKAIQAATETKP